MLILAIDLGKAKSVTCWYQTDDATHEFRAVPTRPADFHTLLADRPADRVVIEVCDAAGWVHDIAAALGIAGYPADASQPAPHITASQLRARAGSFYWARRS